MDLLLVSEDVVEACRKFGAALAVENNLAGANVAVSHSLIMHEVHGSKDLLRQVLQYGLRNCSYALRQVVEAPVGGVVLNDRHTTLWTVPLSRMDFDEAVNCRVAIVLVLSRRNLLILRGTSVTVAAVVLPVCDPVD